MIVRVVRGGGNCESSEGGGEGDCESSEGWR